MNEQLLLELINRDIDGLLSPDEQSQLRDELNRNPQAQKLHDELHSMNKQLGSVADVDPPADLYNSVMRSLPPEVVQERQAGRRSSQSHGRSGFGGLLRTFFASPWRPAFAGAAAVVIVFLLINMDGVKPNEGSVPGTIAALPDYKLVDAGAVDDVLTSSLLTNDQSMILKVKALDAKDLNLELSYDSRIISAVKAEELQQSDDGTLHLNIQGGDEVEIPFELRTSDVATFSLQGSADGREIQLELSNR